MTTQLVCEHPKTILNPKLGELIAKYHSYILFGQEYYEKYVYKSLFRLNKKKFYNVIDKVTTENINQHVVYCKETGEIYPIFIQVPCNDCVLCKNRKQNSFVQRCRLESQLYDCYPWFVTLTYNDNNLPRDGVSVRDCQLFMKRLRVNLSRHGINENIRFVLVSEYGSKTHRAHYHALFFNLKPSVWCSYDQIKDIISESWSNGFITSRLVDLCDDKSFRYTSKYLRKDCEVPEGCNPTFILYSRRGGSIGAPFLDKVKDKINKSLNINYQYLDKWTNKVTPLRFDGYVLNRLFPSYSKLIPSELRVSAQKFRYHFECFKQTDPSLTFLFEQTNEWINNFLTGRIFLPVCHSNDTSVQDLRTDSTTFGLLQECARKIGKFRDTIFFFGEAEEAQKRRDLFLSKLFRYSEPVDIAALGFSVRKCFSRSRALEVL